MKSRAIVLAGALVLVVLTACAHGAGEYFEGWDAGLVGPWYRNTISAFIDVRNVGGNPGGYLYNRSLSDDVYGAADIGAVPRPPIAAGDYNEARVYQVSFDVMPIRGHLDRLWFRVRFHNSTWNGWHYLLTRPHPFGVWTSDTIPIDPIWSDASAIAAGWVKEDVSPSFRETMSNVYTAEVRMQISSNGGMLEAGLDNFHLHTTVTSQVPFDILPGQCPNYISLGDALSIDRPRGAGATPGGRLLPAVIIGSSALDVHQVDVSSVSMLGLHPLVHEFDDVVGPGVPSESGDCACGAVADGHEDLVLMFDLDSVLARLSPCTPGETRTLEMTAWTTMGRALELRGRDCVNLTGKATGGGGGFPIVASPARRTRLERLSPNPFNAATGITIALGVPEDVRLDVYDVLGRRVRTLLSGPLEAGEHEIVWDGRDDRGRSVSSGIYLCRLQTESIVDVRQMVLMK